MIFVFQVEPGILVNLDTNTALWSVGKLKELLVQKTQVPVEKQVLLINGGTALDQSEKVCTYTDAGGADECNPIFLFSTLDAENTATSHYYSQAQDLPVDATLRDEIRRSEGLSDTTDAINFRCKLAQKIYDYCSVVFGSIERLVKDQLLQQQGWMAAIANLEDHACTFQKNFQSLQTLFDQYGNLKSDVEEALENVGEALQSLDKVPLLPSLLSFSPFEQSSDESTDSGVDQASSLERQKVSLMQWLVAKDPTNSSAARLLDHGRQLCDKLDHSPIDDAKIDLAHKGPYNNDMKQIKGITERLARLEQWKESSKKILESIGGSVAALTSNQKRFLTVKDPTVLPELCSSHKMEIVGMVQKMNQLLDTRTRLLKSKLEMCENLVYRLRWLIHIERSIAEVNNCVLMQQDNFQKLKRFGRFLEHIHSAPQVYQDALREVLRRRSFLDSFHKWREQTESTLNILESEEVRKRHEIFDKLDGHFLSPLFRSFAIPPPDPQGIVLPLIAAGDSNLPLPRIRDHEIEWLFAQLNVKFDIEHSRPLFGQSALACNQTELFDQLRNIKELSYGVRNAVDEIRSVLECVKAASCYDIKMISAKLEDAVKAAEVSVEQRLRALRDDLENKREIEIQCLEDRLENWRVNCDTLRKDLNDVSEEKDMLRKEVEELKLVRDRLQDAVEASEARGSETKKLLEDRQKSIILEHEVELEGIQSKLNEEVKALKMCLEECQSNNKLLSRRVEELEEQLLLANSRKEAAVNELDEKNLAETRKLENGFKQTMDKTLHEMQLYRELLSKAQEELNERKHELNKNASLTEKEPGSGQKDGVGDLEAKTKHTKELDKLREEMMKQLEAQKQRLTLQFKHEMEVQRSRFRMVTSKATSDLTDPDNMQRSMRLDSASNPNPANDSRIEPTSTPSSPKVPRGTKDRGQPKLSVGSIVKVEYDPNRSAWTVVGNTELIYLVHTDWANRLGDPAEHVMVKIVQMECCAARKDGNRYNLPRGTQFYRIAVEKLEKVT